MRQPVALCVFVVGILFLTARYYVPTALERPILLSVLAFFWIGLGLALTSTWSRSEWTACASHYRHSVRRLRSHGTAWQLWAVPLALVARAFLAQSVAEWPQCTVPGIHVSCLLLSVVC
ncbi:hypothetical protein BD289DRAFT_105877 [Coniella lustricola]|uniref:Uncharacterized protein n=1 Tax=Coniella lustricola TaxID=2025994 RepID=A0A2T2ZXR2_9PEZI|nr:hypothetical protein BD289DRAFT_105877 [Coniella lustricola]